MPLSDQGCFVAGSAEDVRDVGRVGVRAGKGVVQRSYRVDVRVLPGQDDGAAGCTD